MYVPRQWFPKKKYKKSVKAESFSQNLDIKLKKAPLKRRGLIVRQAPKPKLE